MSGCGKSTLGQALADALGFPFIDGDHLHPQANIDKMAAGHPLEDSDRCPWLKLIRAKAEDLSSTTELGVVVACSALKRSYRDILRGKKDGECSSPQNDSSPPDTLPTFFVFLKGAKDVLRQRMEERSGHFMKSNMLDSQLATLESPEGEDGVVVVNIEDRPEDQVRIACVGLRTFLHPTEI